MHRLRTSDSDLCAEPLLCQPTVSGVAMPCQLRSREAARRFELPTVRQNLGIGRAPGPIRLPIAARPTHAPRCQRFERLREIRKRGIHVPAPTLGWRRKLTNRFRNRHFLENRMRGAEPVHKPLESCLAFLVAP